MTWGYIAKVEVPLWHKYYCTASSTLTNNVSVFTPHLFQFVIQTTSRSAWVSLSAPTAQRALWCTSSSGFPHAGSSPPLLYQYDSPDIHKNPVVRHHINHVALQRPIVGGSITQQRLLCSPDEWLLTSRSDSILWPWTGWGYRGSSEASGWSPWTGCHPHTEESEPVRKSKVEGKWKREADQRKWLLLTMTFVEGFQWYLSINTLSKLIYVVLWFLIL